MTKKEFVERFKDYPDESNVLINNKIVSAFIIEDSKDENAERCLNIILR